MKGPMLSEEDFKSFCQSEAEGQQDIENEDKEVERAAYER